MSNKQAFIDYLNYTLIPDLTDSGSHEMVKDLNKCLEYMEGPDELTQAIIDGPLNMTVYEIWHYIKQGNAMDYVHRLYQHEGDKIHTFYRPILKRVLGCRRHLVQNCQNSFCKEKV